MGAGGGQDPFDGGLVRIEKILSEEAIGGEASCGGGAKASMRSEIPSV